MTIPDYQSIMLPLLEFAADGKEHETRETINHISDLFELSEEERKKLLPSGSQEIIDNRVGWAKTYLKKAGLLKQPRRGIFKITERGLKVLEENPEKIDNRFLKKFSEFREFRSRDTGEEEEEISSTQEKTPIESLEQSYLQLRNELADEILETLHSVTPQFFEKLVIELLVKMGCGGSLREVGKAIGGTGDEGVDGVIKEDRLGLDNIFIQAKRWQSSVGRTVIQAFVGALQGQKARKGIMITTSKFTQEAYDYVDKIEIKVALIDGNQLADLMIDHNLGVTPKETYTIKDIDTDYFQET
jgi:restriction system protein